MTYNPPVPEQEIPTLIDTHQHWWDVSRFRLDWHGELPELATNFGPREYAAQFAPVARRARIAHALWMECDVAPSEQVREAYWVRETGAGTNLAGIIPSCRPEHDGFEKHLDALEAVGEIRGLRRVLFSQPDETSQSTLFRDNIRLLAQRNWTFDLCVFAPQLPVIAELIRACPDVHFILDHCGNPKVCEGTGEAFEAWKSGLKLVAELPNVTAKLSGIVVSADPDWTTDTLRPFIETVAETFGADRCLWGSDWPVCLLRASLADWTGAFLDIAQSWSDADRRAIFETTARRVYRIPPTL